MTPAAAEPLTEVAVTVSAATGRVCALLRSVPNPDARAGGHVDRAGRTRPA
jgi:hypothetical protein